MEREHKRVTEPGYEPTQRVEKWYLWKDSFLNLVGHSHQMSDTYLKVYPLPLGYKPAS
jgi:hypothetical protein